MILKTKDFCCERLGLSPKSRDARSASTMLKIRARDLENKGLIKISLENKGLMRVGFKNKGVSLGAIRFFAEIRDARSDNA